jgi:hydrogenase nickel incorporation protein HypA/HybF
MHELSLAVEMAGQIAAVAAEARARRVTAVAVCIGELSGVEPEALKACFPLAMEGTVAAGAELEIELVHAQARCRSCGAVSDIELPVLECGTCGGVDVEIVDGRDFVITSLEIE